MDTVTENKIRENIGMDESVVRSFIQMDVVKQIFPFFVEKN